MIGATASRAVWVMTLPGGGAPERPALSFAPLVGRSRKVVPIDEVGGGDAPLRHRQPAPRHPRLSPASASTVAGANAAGFSR